MWTKKFKNVTVIFTNENIEEYIIGIKQNKDDFKNYLIIKIYLKCNNFLQQIYPRKTSCFLCMFSFINIKHKSIITFRLKKFGNNNYLKLFHSVKAMTHWISKHFPQFNKINN